MKLLIQNGRVICPETGHDAVADVLIEDGRIAGVGPGLSTAGAEVIDAAGLVVAPGFIDIHVHLREPGFEHAETIETGTQAAAAGGFTTVCCMPNTNPVNDSVTVTKYIVETARRKASINVFPIGAITKGSNGEELASIGSMIAAGAVAISDDGKPVMNARVIRRAMETARALDIPVIEHCEDLNLSAGGDMHECDDSVRLGLRGIPSASEDVMVARDIILAELTGVRYHVAHISTRNAVAMVAYAKQRGLRVTAEATQHHIALDTGHMKPYDSAYKMKPPLRCDHDVKAVVEGVVSGAIDCLATDHAPHAGDDKMQEFERCPFGIIGLETALGVSLEVLVHSGLISLPRLIALYTSEPARVIGWKGELARGALKPGYVGDVTVFHPEYPWVYDVKNSLSKSSNTPFGGRTFQGGPILTIVNGQVVWRAPGF
ncbi:dihydroorotase [Paludibaculum fermentans]|uniref:dihydroorotase n=1 Tax=Paludibaculum fermentans TaxID=1473598 RepID=UPI003EBC1C4C